MNILVYYFKFKFLFIWILIFFLYINHFAVAQNSYHNYNKFKEQLEKQVTNIVNEKINKYCASLCEVLRVNAYVIEDISENVDLGFEALSSHPTQINYHVDKISIDIQVDTKVSKINRERLSNIIKNSVSSLASQVEVNWKPIVLPEIDKQFSFNEQLKQQLENRISQAVNETINKYCPNKCLLASVNIDANTISVDDETLYSSRQIFKGNAHSTSLKINDILINLAMDESLDEDTRTQISTLIKTKTSFVEPVRLHLDVYKFPIPYTQKLVEENSDPYGLEKLRQMLIMFRDLAGTKEIITNTKNISETSSSSSETIKSDLKQTNTEVNKEQSRASVIDSKSQTSETNLTTDWIMYGSALLLVLIIVALIWRFVIANKDAKIMIEAANMPSKGAKIAASGNTALIPADDNIELQDSKNLENTSKQLSLKLKVEDLKSSLMQHFLEMPKVAKETFSRMLREEGVEATARYLHLFGHVIILELLEDPSLQRDIYALSEFFHKSNFNFTLEEEYELLKILKNKLTASEIKVLSSKTSDTFDFLSKLDSTQIYNLIINEKAQIQSVVLTQLDKKKRMAVFDMYHGEAKVNLMRELCKADAIPKEYLFNVAKALRRKVSISPEFDTENIRSSEIIIDLLEKADLKEQRDIMHSLQSTNPDVARGIMMKLVTIEMLPYLKDGHLLELILGINREDLLIFLAGTRDHIRNLILSKAPQELAESWLEDLTHVVSIDETSYKLVEMKILSRIRALAESGNISVLDINMMLFSLQGQTQFHNLTHETDTIKKLSSSAIVA